MKFSTRTVGTIEASGKITERTITVERWNGCPCVFPGRDSCECKEDCPCRNVNPTRQRPDAFDRPWGE